MILILSNKACTTTNNVINYFISNDIPFLRINSEDRIELLELNLSYSIFKHHNKLYNSLVFNSVWFYRGKFNLQYSIQKNDLIFDLYNEIKSHLNDELKLVEYLFVNTFKGKILGNYFSPNSNKLKALLIAQKIGFKIPKTKIITQKQQLETILSNTNIITKGIQDSATLEYLNTNSSILNVFTNYSTMVNKKDIEKIPNSFFPTLIQEYIEKKYELRIFYLNKKCYAIAIFSQRNEKTKIDFRHYDYENENKQIPYTLPKKIEKKIIVLMDKMKLNTGSIDVIVDKNDQYIFLEINPVGLFEVVDYYGNYNLYKKIANYLL